MLTKTEPLNKPPDYLKDKIPSVAAFATVLEDAVVKQPIETVFYRAAYGEKYVLPDILKKAYRFGPPRALRNTDGTLPFSWLYVALDMPTAIWESQFAKSDASAAGRFYLDENAVESGVLAQFTLNRELTLWDLTGLACSKLGIFDTISSADHEVCHWIGYHVREAMLQCAPGKMPDGFLYPSRRVRGRFAIAIVNSLLPELQKIAEVECEQFKGSAEYMALLNDPLRIDSPAPTKPFPDPARI
jgi:RES domain